MLERRASEAGAAEQLEVRRIPGAKPVTPSTMARLEIALGASDIDRFMRQQPICRHFGQCGGCVAQHMSPELYRGWKSAALLQAFASRGIQIEPEPMRIVAAQSRRRRTRRNVDQLGNVRNGELLELDEHEDRSELERHFV